MLPSIVIVAVVILVIVACVPPRPKLHVVTVITDPNDENFLKLYNSAMIHNISFVPLLSPRQIGHGTGFGMKIKLMRDYVQTVPDRDIVMFVDGYDVLITGTDKEIKARFERFRRTHGNKALFSGEYFCWPDEYKKHQYPEVSNTPYKYLNSGTYISTAGALKKLYKVSNVDMDSEEFAKIDDQRFYTDLYLQHKDLIVLDTYNTIFNCLVYGLQDIELRNGVWYNKVTNSYPVVFHGNGGGEVKQFVFERIYPTITKTSS